MNEVKEIQGPYGPFSLSERVVQWIWACLIPRDAEYLTVSQKTLRILHPGKWNRHEGPDFLGAEFEIDGQSIQADVEVHFEVADWMRHEHQFDPHFNRVGLHVVLFPPPATGRPAFTSDGESPDTFCLLPYLESDLESYAEAYALQADPERQSPALAALEQLGKGQRLQTVYEAAVQRWQQKQSHHAHMLEQYSPQAIVHYRTLEVLGYKRNRHPMRLLAETYTPEQILTHSIDTLIHSQQTHWKRAGLRPANRPEKRLEQYRELLQRERSWWKDAYSLLDELAKTSHARRHLSTKTFRKEVKWQQRSNDWQQQILKGCIPRNRALNLLLDFAMPYFTARSGSSLQEMWFHTPAGDIPEQLKQMARTLELTSSEYPLSNGIIQGLLQLVYTE